MILNPVEIEKIKNWTKSNQVDVHLELIVTNDTRSQMYRDFCDILTENSSNISVQIKNDFDKKVPSLKIKENLIYQAIPKGKELDVFLELLAYKNNTQSGNCININVPAFIKIYVSEHCPYCPAIVREIASLALENEKAIVTVIDGGLFHEMAQNDKIMAVPTLIFDDNLRWTGAVKVEDVIEIIINRKPEELSFNALRTMIESGKASSIATLMINANQIIPAYYDLLTHQKWPLRLGAMVAMEQIIDEKNKLANEIVQELWNRFDQVDVSVKGDILYMAGELCSMSDLSRFELIVNGNFPDELKEAAQEAKERLLNSTGEKK